MEYPQPFDLDGRTALVTGSSRGIGAAIALALAEAGADLVLHYVGNQEAVDASASQVKAMGRSVRTVQADLAADDGPRRLMQQTGPVDILVANASVQIPEPWRDVDRGGFDRQVAANFRATFELIQLAAPGMIERGWGRILTVGSVQESVPHPDMVVYAATKCAQTSMVHSFAKQFAPDGVTVNNLAPGVILTDRNTGRLADESYAEKVRGAIPSGRFGETTDCVGAAVLLCSEAGRYITGQSIYVDGGMSL